MAKDKRFWAHVAAGSVATIAIICGVWQCSEKDDARFEANQWKQAYNDNKVVKEDLDAATAAVTAANGKIRELRDSIDVCKDLIAQKDSTILVLRDSLDTCRDAKACDCKPGAKKVGCDCNKKPAAPKKNTSAKPAPAKPAPVQPSEPKKVVEVTSGEDKVVIYDDAKKPDQAVIVNGDNSGTIIVNANGIVKDVNTNAPSNNRKQMMNACRTTTTVVLGTRSKCR